MQNGDILSLQSLIKEVIDKQNNMGNKLNEIEKTLMQLNMAVVGNPTYGQKGMIEELNDVKKYVHRDKMTKSKIMGGLAVVGVFWTIIWEFVKRKIMN